MQKLNIHLPKYRLSVQFRFIKRRRSPLDEPIIPTVKSLNLKYHVGNTIHKFLRHIFEHKKVRALLGTNIALMLVVSSFMPTNIVGKDQNEAITSINNSDTPINTEVGTQFPVSSIKITQGYKFYHPGLDLDGITGDPVRPIKKGKVISIDYSKYAYGNSIVIDHGNKLTSLYAHLSKIEVDENQEVTTDTILGEMGATGRSSGDHLHLEVRDHNLPINPLTVLPR